MFDQLDQLEDRFRDLETQLADPDVASDGARYTVLAKQHAELADVVATFRRWRQAGDDLGAAREMAADAEGEDRTAMRAEIDELTATRAALEEELKLLLVPKDPNDDRDVILEVRPAAGGDEAALFAGELLEMYRRYAQGQGWRTEILSRTEQGVGGVKEAVVEITGRSAYAHLKHESGVHRVQRVPATESQGRIHTSTASVAVLPVAEEVDVQVEASDLRVDVFRSSGPGGQSVNTTDSAVRITHLPTGLVVSCQDEKSQHQNRDKAMTILRARLLQAEQERAAKERADERKGQIGTGDRSEKIRTYNFPQSRVTDHRIGLTLHDLSGTLAGDLTPIVDAVRRAEREAKLAALDD
ncbi:peptide chain release factor 1 [Nitriliruptor alkaliphilus]|uniref:peptide chain release factor 1 n=1 Tax=Nitriliruptor alkaliphilus TaxID=427918 RepID=UPI0006960A32|nr:peptide chain release factor 1 [Nitriliruptor alkaliphilus]